MSSQIFPRKAEQNKIVLKFITTRKKAAVSCGLKLVINHCSYKIDSTLQIFATKVSLTVGLQTFPYPIECSNLLCEAPGYTLYAEPSCLIDLSLWNCGVSTMSTHMVGSSMIPWTGSLKTCKSIRDS